MLQERVLPLKGVVVGCTVHPCVYVENKSTIRIRSNAGAALSYAYECGILAPRNTYLHVKVHFLCLANQTKMASTDLYPPPPLSGGSSGGRTHLDHQPRQNG